MASVLSRLEAFGIGNPWFAWSLARGAFDEVCTRCRGRRFVVGSPCENREPGYREPPCDAEEGCERCRSTCLSCRGEALTGAPAVLVEDFGDEESLALARRMVPGLHVGDVKRIDMDAPALGGR